MNHPCCGMNIPRAETVHVCVLTCCSANAMDIITIITRYDSDCGTSHSYCPSLNPHTPHTNQGLGNNMHRWTITSSVPLSPGMEQGKRWNTRF